MIKAERRGGRAWYRFSRSWLSIIGLVLVSTFVLLALFAPWVTPYPDHVDAFIDFTNVSQPPSSRNWFGTDPVGRDVFSRVIFAYRISLWLSLTVLAIAVPLGVAAGLIAGYFGGRLESAIMRLVDIFLSIPSLVMALVVLGLVTPTLTNAMLAIAFMWWPWYARLLFNLTRTLKSQGFVTAAQVIGASHFHILFREILPNCVPSVLTKMTLDMSFVMLLAASLGFLGLGVQPPTPELGSMIAEGAEYLPSLWWLSIFPGLAVLVAVLGFNLAGDGLRDLLSSEQ